jgi:hypothetical protein
MAGATNRYSLYADIPTSAYVGNDAWTMMVYMTASDLEEFAFETINELELVAAQLPPNVNLGVFYDQSGRQSYVTPWRQANGQTGVSSWTDAGWALIQPDTDRERVATRFERLGERNSGDPSTLQEFLRAVITAAPADRYGLVMWNHGAGIRGFNFDDNDGNLEPNDRLNSSELAVALSTVLADPTLPRLGDQLDLLAFDACLMAMAEVGWTLRAYAKTVVASEDVVVADGYDYPAALSVLGGNPRQVDEQDLAASFVLSFQNAYLGNPRGADTHSAIISAQYDALAFALSNFTNQMLTRGTPADWLLVREARQASASFQNSADFRDLGQFFRGIAARGVAPVIQQAAATVVNALDSLVIARASDRRDTSGLSIYVPPPGSDEELDEYFDEYSTSVAAQCGNYFACATGWDRFLQQFVTGSDPIHGTLDWAESNESPAESFNLHRLTGPDHVFTDLSLHSPADHDWYRFFTQDVTAGNNRLSISVSFDHLSGAVLDLRVEDASGNRLAGATQLAPGMLTLVLPAGLPASEYRVHVEMVTSGGNASRASSIPYTLSIDAPRGTLPSDPVHGNDRFSKAHDLGVISGGTLFSGLVVDGRIPDYYRFSTPKTRLVTAARVLVRGAENTPLTVRLLDAAGVTLRGDNGNPLEVSGTGELSLPYESGSGQSHGLAISTTNGLPIRYSIRFSDAPQADFDQDGNVNVADIDLLCAAIKEGRFDRRYDLHADGTVDRLDLDLLVEGILRSSYGDANLDGRFDSSDLVQIFQRGEYDDTIPGNSTWADGDWDCDGEFDSSDLVLAFQRGRYEG